MEYFNKKIVDFGVVYINTKHTICFKVENHASISQIFKVEKYEASPKLDWGFLVKPAVSPSVKPAQDFCFTVEFNPKVVNTKCCDYFVIKQTFGMDYILHCKASVKGPDCSLSCKLLQIMCPVDKKKLDKKFELMNFGDCPVNFQFTVDNLHSCVTVHPSHGRIEPSTNTNITASYTPTNFKPYFKRMFCLVEHHEPIVLDIYALWSKDVGKTFHSKQENLPRLNGYHCFMNNVTYKVLRNEVPPISVDRYYIDFNHCQPRCMKKAKFSLTNNLNLNLSLIWNQDARNIFVIHPTQVGLEGNDSVEFKVTFKPVVKDMLYGACLEAQLFAANGVATFPVEVSLRGHSFEEASCGWAAQYRVEPRHLVLPPCLPCIFQPSHATVTIHKRGHLPLSFKFHPPNHTNFSVKPQQGLIHGDFQIILVQFLPKSVNNAVYIEKWMLSFNSNENTNNCLLDFEGSVETPQLIINGGLDLVFPTVHPGTTCDLLVNLYNPTRFNFFYKVDVIKEDSVLEVGDGGEMWPNEHKQVCWHFQPLGKGELEALVCYTPTDQGDGIKVKASTVVVRATCLETELKVIPQHLLFKNVLLGCEHERGFEITNTGEALIKGSLMIIPDESYPLGDDIVRFQPDFFYLKPGASTTITVFANPQTSGTKVTLIGYKTHEQLSVSPLLTVLINCVFSHFQITDIRLNNTGPLFTRFHLWKMLHVNKLNEKLRGLRPEKCEEVKMYLPSYLCTSDNINIEFLLENLSEIRVCIAITKKVDCACKPVMTNVHFSRSTLKDICPHKDQMCFTPKSATVEAQSYVILNMTVSYSTVGSVKCLFTLSLIPEDNEEMISCVGLHFSRTSIPEATPFIDTIGCKESEKLVFCMKSVYIGDCYPTVQSYVMYNNTKHSAQYDVDARALQGTPFKYVGKKNVIPSMSRHALLFTFLPNSCESYEAEIKITINNEPIKLVLRGTGVPFVPKCHEDCGEFFPREEKIVALSPTSVFLTLSHIDIGPLKPSSVQRHIIFLNNETRDVISFKWHSTKQPDILELRVHPVKGAIQPYKGIECRVICYTKGWPCHITSAITCVFASFTKYANAVQTTQKYREDLAMCSDYFIITEHGTENVELAPPTDEWPQKSFLTISVTLDVRYDSLVYEDQFIPLAPSIIQLAQAKDALIEISEEHRQLISFVLEMVLWEALGDLCGKSGTTRKEPLERYIQIRDPVDLTEVAVPCQTTQDVLEDILYSAWQDVFQLTARNSTEYLRRTLINQINTYVRTGVHSEDSIIKIPSQSSINESFSSLWSSRLKYSK